MKHTSIIATIVLCLLFAQVLLAQEVQLHTLGESVDLDARAPRVVVTSAIPRPGHESILCRFSITPGDSSPTSYLLSGKVVSDNTGVGVERVALFIGPDGIAPSLAAMTNADGEFKFRLWITEDDRPPKLSLPTFAGSLYVGGVPSQTYRNRLRLMSGYSIRYQLKDLADAIDANVESVSEKRQSEPASEDDAVAKPIFLHVYSNLRGIAYDPERQNRRRTRSTESEWVRVVTLLISPENPVFNCLPGGRDPDITIRGSVNRLGSKGLHASLNVTWDDSYITEQHELSGELAIGERHPSATIHCLYVFSKSNDPYDTLDQVFAETDK